MVGPLNPMLAQFVESEHTSGFIARFRKRHSSAAAEQSMARPFWTCSILGDALPE